MQSVYQINTILFIMKRLLKPIFLIPAIISCITLSASAQNDVADTRPMWGIKAAFDVNIPGKWHGDAGSVSMFRHGFGATFGAVYNIYLGKSFYIEPGASLFYDSYSYKNLVISGDAGNIIEEDPSLYKLGIRIPVVVGYSFSISDNFAMLVYTGPELSYAFTGDIKIKDSELQHSSDISLFGEYGTQRRVDCAWKVGVGFPVNQWLVSIEAAIGMTDLLKSGMSFRENRCSVALTRYF